ncbi:MAG: hypothetical protein ACJ71G_01440, partial [Nitrososphaeraceae archaeon]
DREKAKEVLLSVLPMLKSERKSILENLVIHNKRILDKRTVDTLDVLQEQVDYLNAKMGLKEEKPHPKEDPSEQEVKALYEEIRKALS